jgi:hypothetical protein
VQQVARQWTDVFGGTYDLRLQGLNSAEKETSVQHVFGQNLKTLKIEAVSPKRPFTCG